MEKTYQVHVHIFGDVTGVGYRSWAKRMAEQLGVTGWVQNVGDGRVEILGQGTKASLEEFVSRCHLGPEVAWVQQVDVVWQDVKEDMMEFEIRM